MKNILYREHVEDVAELVYACTTDKVIVWQPKGQRSIASTFLDVSGTVDSMSGEPIHVDKHFQTSEAAIEFIIQAHLTGTILRVTGRNTIWSHIYACQNHPPCETCDTCQIFQRLLNEYGMYDVFELVDGKDGSWYAFDNRHKFSAIITAPEATISESTNASTKTSTKQSIE